MSVLLKNVTNSIWHAFNALPQDKCGYVNKSKLKVLTANIASILDSYGVEKGLEHYRSTTTLNFGHFRYYLLQEVFSQISYAVTLAELRNYESIIEEICWLVCRNHYIKSETSIPEDMLFKLFRIFCMLSDLEVHENNNDHTKVLLHASEAARIVQQLLSGIGLDYESDKQYNKLSMSYTLSLDFTEFLELIKLKDHHLADLTESLNEVIEELYQTLINDIIKKGFILRRGYLFPSMKEYWLVLQPCELTFYKNRSQKEICGSIVLNQNCMVNPCIPLTTTKHDKILKFILTTGDRSFELATNDHKSRLQWITALQLAITYSVGKDGFQRELVARRRSRRYARHQEEQIERTKYLTEAELTKQQLEEEKVARLAAESQAKTLERVVREDSRRVAELEDIKLTLENLLQEEIQAKRDEEIVRALQARVLAEEWEKREELEQLQEEQRILLHQEREKRIQFEMLQRENELKLRDAEKKLKELEIERQKLDIELKQARIKIMYSEETKQKLEARLQIICPPKENSAGGSDRVRRALSFMHSNRERMNIGNEDVRSSFPMLAKHKNDK